MRTPHPGVEESWGLALTRRVARRALRIAFRVRIVGLEHLPSSGPVLLAGNHTGWLDGPTVCIMLPRPSAFLVKSEVYQGWLRVVLDWAQQIPIKRGVPDRSALKRAQAVLGDGGVVGVFPEGTRGTGTLENLQHGIGYLAVKTPCPIVPVVCVGTAEALPKGRRVPRWRTRIDIVFGPAFRVQVNGSPHARSTMAEATEQIRSHLLDHRGRALSVTGRPGAPLAR